MATPPFYPDNHQYTVQELVADRSKLDISQHVRQDPQHSYTVATGGHGDVFKAIFNVLHPVSNQPYDLNVAVKILRGVANQTDMIEKRLNREIACWRRLKHDHVTELLGIAYLNPELPPGLVSKWVLRYDFLKYVGNHPESKRQKAQEIASGLQYLHEKGVVHGDLKADNVVVSDQLKAQITDFGIAQIVDVRGFTTVTERNIRYTAPELMPEASDKLDSEASVTTIPPTKRSDIFSLGILFLQLFHWQRNESRLGQKGMPYNHVAFKPFLDVRLMVRIQGGERSRRERYSYIEDRHWNLICKCWASHPDERPTIVEVQNTL